LSILKKLCIAGSDAHTPFEVGDAYTSFLSLNPETTNIEDIRKKMKHDVSLIFPNGSKRNAIISCSYNIGKKFLSGPIQLFPFLKRWYMRKNYKGFI